MRVMVGICTCERDTLLRELLAWLEAIELGPVAAEAVEILVVDNRPTEATRAICEAAASRLPVRLRYVAEPEPGISAARNRAVAEMLKTAADALAFIDDDDRPRLDWLARLIERWRETGVDIVMGCANRVLPDALSPALRACLEERPLSDAFPLWDTYGLPQRLSTCNVLIGRGILERLSAEGPVFDPAFAFMGGGDSDLFCRARQAGASFVRAERSIVDIHLTSGRASMRGLFKRRFKNGLTHGWLGRRYLAGAARRRWLASVMGQLLGKLATMPLRLASRKRTVQGITRIGWAVGTLYGFIGGRFDYYGR